MISKPLNKFSACLYFASASLILLAQAFDRVRFFVGAPR